MPKKRGPHKLKPKLPIPEHNINNVKTLRIEAGLTVEALAEQAGLATSTVSAIENGRGGYSPRSLHMIAKALRKDPSELLGQDFEMRAIMEAATPTQRKLILATSRAILEQK